MGGGDVSVDAVRVLKRAMPRQQRSGGLSIIQAAAIDDVRLGASALRVLVALGTYADADGWCWPKQRHLAERIGVSQQAISKALRDLESFGYIVIEARYDESSGARLSSRYRIVQDFTLAPEHQRTPQREVVGSQLQIVGSQRDVVPPTTSEVVGPTTPEVVAIERPKRTTQKNDPKDMSDESSERELFDYYRSKIQPAARVCNSSKIRARLQTFSVQELKRGIDNFAASPWWMENNGQRGADWFFHSDRRSEQFLNLTPDRPKSEAPVEQRSARSRVPSESAAYLQTRYGGLQRR